MRHCSMYDPVLHQIRFAAGTQVRPQVFLADPADCNICWPDGQKLWATVGLYRDLVARSGSQMRERVINTGSWVNGLFFLTCCRLTYQTDSHLDASPTC
jgi:hypothetical protein